MVIESSFEPGFLCYGIPVGTPAYCRHMLQDKAFEVVQAAEEMCNVLGNDKQVLWVVLHRSIQHKMDYHLSLS